MIGELVLVHPSPIGPLRVYATGRGVAAIRFGDEAGDARAPVRSGLGREVSRALDRYFSGRTTTFAIPLDTETMTPFACDALTTLAARVPWGKTTTYGELAAMLGKGPAAARAIGQAMGSNPIPIVLPCHRVLAAGGAIGGFSGGLDRKRLLLAIEGVRIAEQTSLF